MGRIVLPGNFKKGLPLFRDYGGGASLLELEEVVGCPAPDYHWRADFFDNSIPDQTELLAPTYQWTDRLAGNNAFTNAIGFGARFFRPSNLGGSSPFPDHQCIYFNGPNTTIFPNVGGFLTLDTNIVLASTDYSSMAVGRMISAGAIAGDANLNVNTSNMMLYDSSVPALTAGYSGNSAAIVYNNLTSGPSLPVNFLLISATGGENGPGNGSAYINNRQTAEAEGTFNQTLTFTRLGRDRVSHVSAPYAEWYCLDFAFWETTAITKVCMQAIYNNYVKPRYPFVVDV